MIVLSVLRLSLPRIVECAASRLQESSLTRNHQSIINNTVWRSQSRPSRPICCREEVRDGDAEKKGKWSPFSQVSTFSPPFFHFSFVSSRRLLDLQGYMCHNERQMLKKSHIYSQHFPGRPCKKKAQKTTKRLTYFTTK